VAVTGAGIALLGGTVLLGAIAQVGVSLCAICHGNDCSFGSQVCPGSVLFLALIVAFLMMEALLVALGLSKPEVARWTIPPSVTGLERARRVRREKPLNILAPFLAFFGWALMALGLMLPLDIFGSCVEPCDYPWVLSGYPLLLVIVGAVLLGSGVALFGTIAVQRRSKGRSAQPRAV
jgi:uncharacterized membrane protein